MVVYPFDEAVHYTNEEFGLDETRMLTRVAPGRYKMVTKTKTGKTGDYEMNFTEHGVFETMTVGGLSASCFYRRLGDFEGTWKVCSKVGAEGYLDACGMPEPMKSELLAANDVVEMKRLGGGKISTKSSSKFMPGENVMKLGEQWEIEMPGFGKMTVCSDKFSPGSLHGTRRLLFVLHENWGEDHQCQRKGGRRKRILKERCNCTCTTKILCWSGDRGLHCGGA